MPRRAGYAVRSVLDLLRSSDSNHPLRPRLGQEAPVDFGRGELGGHRHHLSPRPSLEPLLSGSSPTSPPLPVAREAQGVVPDAKRETP